MDNFYFQKKIKKLNFNNIFYPTDTSRLLINIAKKYLKKNCAISLTGKSGMANLDPKKMLVLNRFDTNDFPQ